MSEQRLYQMALRKDNHDRNIKRHVAVYLSPEEWSVVACIADGRNQSISSLVRNTILDTYMAKKQPLMTMRG